MAQAPVARPIRLPSLRWGRVGRDSPGIAPRLLAVAALTVTLTGLTVALALVDLPWRPATLCPLRALTGIPCPLCGGTTALVGLGSGHLLAGLRASPPALVGAGLVVLAPLGVLGRWWRASPDLRRRTLMLALGLAELWQLARFDIAGL